MVGLVERRAVTAIQYSDQKFVIVGVASELQSVSPTSQFIVDAWAYHAPLFTAFEGRAKVDELPESDFEPDEL